MNTDYIPRKKSKNKKNYSENLNYKNQNRFPPITRNNHSITKKKKKEKGENIMVIVRVRPLLSSELKRGDKKCIKIINENCIQIKKNHILKTFRLNKIFSSNASQSDIFNKTGMQKLLEAALEGYSTTVFAYGQTGSGKTFTIAGKEEDLGNDDYIKNDKEGIIQRSVRYLWHKMSHIMESEKCKFFIKASFLEIYNESINDLLNKNNNNLQCRWDTENGFFVEKLTILDCMSFEDMMLILNEGMKNRKIGSHKLNKDSSRSHSILTIYIIKEKADFEGKLLRGYGKISFVDLAGSERLKETKTKGHMVKETQQINKSLFTLGKVISLLSKKTEKTYIPYRDSKLTMLLMDSLGYFKKRKI